MAGAGLLKILGGRCTRPYRSPGAPPSRDGIAFTFQESDDGRYALVEFVARDRAAFKQILEDNRGDVKVFEKGKHKKDEIENEFKKHKKDVDLDRFGVMLP